MGSHLKLGTLIFRVLLSLVSFFLSLCSLNSLSGNGYLQCLRFLFAAVSFGLRNGYLGVVFTLDSGGVCGSHLDTLLLHSVCLTDLTISARLSYCYLGVVCGFRLRLSLFLTAYGLGLSDRNLSVVFTLDSGSICGGYLNTLILAGVSLTDSTVPVLFGNALFRVVDSLCSGFFTESVDVTGLVVDIGNVYVDKPQTYLFQFYLNIVGNRHKELVTVGIYFLDLHGGDNKTELSEDDILCKLLYLHHLEAQQTLSCILHDTRFSRDTYRKTGRYVHTYILLGKSIFKVNINRNRGQVKILERLDNRHDKSRAAVDTLSAFRLTVLVGTHLTVNYHDFVRRTLSVPRQNCRNRGENDYRNDAYSDQSFRISHTS